MKAWNRKELLKVIARKGQAGFTYAPYKPGNGQLRYYAGQLIKSNQIDEIKIRRNLRILKRKELEK